MKILSVTANARRRGFDVRVRSGTLFFPYGKAQPAPTPADAVTRVFTDPELGNEAFTFQLRSGREGTVHVEQVLDYNKDPSYLRDLVLYGLTIEAQRRIAQVKLSKREIIRRLGTSPTQLYRLLDQTNYSKSVDQLLRLLNVLECEVDFVVRAKCA